jgi:hypothetical protein
MTYTALSIHELSLYVVVSIGHMLFAIWTVLCDSIDINLEGASDHRYLGRAVDSSNYEWMYWIGTLKQRIILLGR